ncbi:M23 family metallopeptidase [Pseudarthrobacter sp. PH31-O2]|uniref:M23 family metallopeptidase n=1 Tax=Pseudarthrobacter sp. PH31-O2 TaxID=3046206 RepID=UPI0024B906D5|nr:M23 family metallopeptidase [Pseudarthrobacter sp. PH31-O2]
MLSFGVQGLAGSGTAGLPARVLASGVVGPGTLAADGGGIPAVSAVGALAATSFTADALALLAYNRSSVLTTPRDGVAVQLNVASAGLKRPAEGFLMAPLESLHESSPFGQRISPISGAPGEFHWGQDYSAPCGTRVYSADAGVVRAVGWHPWGGGNRVEIDHGNGLVTTYNHLEGIAVKKGDSVRVGQVIARVGTTGSSTGCHLHFETILNGSHKNPHEWILLPTVQTDQLGALVMTSYAPNAGLPSNTSLGWAIPGSRDRSGESGAGAQAAPATELPQLPNLIATPTTSTTTPPTTLPVTTPPAPTPPTTTPPTTPPAPTPPTAPPTTPATATPTPTPTVTPASTPTPTPTTEPTPLTAPRVPVPSLPPGP